MKKLLIVDDSEYMRTLIKVNIANQGFIVVGEAESGNSGAEKYKELKPDIVTMDLTMDEGDGVDAIKQITSHDPGAKIVVISSLAGQDPFINEAKEAGAKAVINKTSLEHDLVKTLNKVLAE